MGMIAPEVGASVERIIFFIFIERKGGGEGTETSMMRSLRWAASHTPPPGLSDNRGRRPARDSNRGPAGHRPTPSGRATAAGKRVHLSQRRTGGRAQFLAHVRCSGEAARSPQPLPPQGWLRGRGRAARSHPGQRARPALLGPSAPAPPLPRLL